MITKKKILVGSIVVALLMVSAPLISALNATPVTTQSTTISSIVTAEQAIAEAKATTNSLLQNCGQEPGIAVMCQRINAVLSSTGSGSFCSNLAVQINNLSNLIYQLNDQLSSLRSEIDDALAVGALLLAAKLMAQYDKNYIEEQCVELEYKALVSVYMILCFGRSNADLTNMNNAQPVVCACTQ